MALSGYLSEYSLAEIFQFVQQGYKTGLLSIAPDNDSVQSYSDSSYIWFQNGRVMAHARDASHLGLLSMIAQRDWISRDNLSAFHEQLKATNQPLGLYLKTTGVLDAEQLRLLFHSQVLQPVCGLFKIANAKFSFDEQAPLSYPEMTGLSVTAGEASLLGLRVLRDWSLLEHKLPAPEFGLQKLRPELPSFKLDTQEIQVWELANSDISITQIAKTIDLTLLKVQQISFRLAAVGLVKEIALDLALPPLAAPAMAVAAPAAPSAKAAGSKPTVSKSFLGNLVGFLKKRV
jgi:Domain of unknown function (DUF4388)